MEAWHAYDKWDVVHVSVWHAYILLGLCFCICFGLHPGACQQTRAALQPIPADKCLAVYLPAPATSCLLPAGSIAAFHSVNPVAAYLFAPTQVWVTIAAKLNYDIVKLNPNPEQIKVE
jgi:hypothetical protein